MGATEGSHSPRAHVDGREPQLADRETLVEAASQIAGMPTEMVALLFSTHEPAELDRLMDRAFGGAYDDIILQTLVTLTNGFAHTLERFRRRQGRSPIKLRCVQCQERR